MNLDWLLQRFGEAAQQPAMIWRGRECSYRSLSDQFARWLEEFRDRQLAPHTIVAVEADYSPDACALLLALIAHDAVVVPLSPASAKDHSRMKTIAEVQAAYVQMAEGWRFERIENEVRNPLSRRLIELGHPGLVLFSSGSSGESKAALHDFTRLLTKFQIVRRPWRMISFLLFDHIGGLNTLLYSLANRGTLVVAEDRAPEPVCKLVEDHQVELLPTSPTFLNLLLLSEAHTRHDLSSLKVITYGTEPMTATTLARLREALPAVQLSQTYGLSELGILATKSEASDSLWMKVGGAGFETKVVDGVLWIRAESAMLGYLNAASPFDSMGWFNTGDEVEVQGDFVRVLGRRSEIINVGGEKFHPAQVESVIQALPNVVEVTVRGEPNLITGQAVVAQIVLEVPEDIISLRNRVRMACREKLAAYKVPARVEIASERAVSARFKKLRSVPQAA